MADGTVLTPQQMRGVTARLIDTGQNARALEFAEALLVRDPQDVEALLLQARAARALGQRDLALSSARKAWRLAEGDVPRYAAASVMAQVLSSRGARTRAQLWLRRAAQIAPNDQLKASAKRDFRYVRSRNPLSVNLSFSISPVSNINNGAVRPDALVDTPFGTVRAELLGKGLALSGTEVSSGVSLRYRLENTATAQSYAYLNLSNRSYRLSDDAKKIAPKAKGSDYDLTAASITLLRAGRNPVLPGPYQLTGAFSRTWRGGKAYSEGWRVSARQSLALGKTRSVFFDVARGQTLYLGSVGATIQQEYKLGLNQQLPKGVALNLAFAHRRSLGTSQALDYVENELSAKIRLARPVLGLGWRFGVTAADKLYDGSLVSGVNRSEQSLRATVTADIKPLEMYGFVPTVTLQGRKVDANLPQFERADWSVRLGLQSSF